MRHGRKESFTDKRQVLLAYKRETAENEKERVNLAGENIFEMIADYTMNERMIKILLADQQYQEVQSQIGSQMKLLEGLHLEKEKWMIVDRLVSLYADSGAMYGRITYQQGYKDCAALLQAMSLLKSS